VVSKTVFLIDSFALMAYLTGEAGGSRVQELFAQSKDRKCRLLMNIINLGEVLYITERMRGLTMAQNVLALVESLPLELVDAGRDLVLDAAHIKAKHALSYADAFAAATAIRENAVIVTGDPEFKSIEQLTKIEWLIA